MIILNVAFSSQSAKAASISESLAESVAEITFPANIDSLDSNRAIDIDQKTFVNNFLQFSNSIPNRTDGNMDYQVLGKTYICDNCIYFINIYNAYSRYVLLCCFSERSEYPKIIIIYRWRAFRPGSLKTTGVLFDFSFDNKHKSISVVDRVTKAEYPTYKLSVYGFDKNGVNTIFGSYVNLQNQVISVKDLDIEDYGYYIDERDSVEVREVRTPWKKPELKIK